MVCSCVKFLSSPEKAISIHLSEQAAIVSHVANVTKHTCDITLFDTLPVPLHNNGRCNPPNSLFSLLYNTAYSFTKNSPPSGYYQDHVMQNGDRGGATSFYSNLSRHGILRVRLGSNSVTNSEMSG